MEKANKDILVIDDDPIFTGLLVELLSRRGYSVDGYGSVVEMGSFACLRFYHLVLLDYRLEHLNGLEIAEYVDLFFPTTPVLLTSAFAQVEAQRSTTRWPDCVKGFVSKSEGAASIVDACETILQRKAADVAMQWHNEDTHGGPLTFPRKREKVEIVPPWGK